MTIIDPHDGSWAARTDGWPKSLSTSTRPALTNNDVQAVAAGLTYGGVTDPRTGGQMPTFGVIYGTGADCASVIKSDGTVQNRSGTNHSNAVVAIHNNRIYILIRFIINL